jgi:hypothetical protein
MHPYRTSAQARDAEARTRSAVAWELVVPVGLLWAACLGRVVAHVIWLVSRGWATRFAIPEGGFGAIDTIALGLVIVLPLLLVERRRRGASST